MNLLITLIPFYGAFFYADNKLDEIHPDYFRFKNNLISPYDEFLLKALVFQIFIYFFSPLLVFALINIIF